MGCLRSLRNSYLNFVFTVKTRGLLVTFFLLHFVASFVIFSHFFYKKWMVQEAILPKGATNYWQKHVIPPLEFGTMHVMLFQMALLPLTMCRYFATHLRATRLKRYVPFDYMVYGHIYLGYVVGLILLVSFGTFLGFFGNLCYQFKNGTEKADFCAKFTSEIMITGYVILGIYLLMFVTSAPHLLPRFSFFKFEYFYSVHHLFFAFYIVAILHTLDVEFRTGKAVRSQTWKWLAVPFGFYLFDRFMYNLTRKETEILDVKLYSNPKSIVLKLRKPSGFGFRAGQYLFLNVPQISKFQWHPFSIVSTNEDHYLKLYIKVCKNGWTEKLYNLQEKEMCQNRFSNVIVMGPYGSANQDMSSFNQVAMIGGGSGIVPLMSLLNQCISNQLMKDEYARQKTGDHYGYSSNKYDESTIAGVSSGAGAAEEFEGELYETDINQDNYSMYDYSESAEEDQLGDKSFSVAFGQSFFYNGLTFIGLLVDFAFIGLSFSWYMNGLTEKTIFVEMIEFCALLIIYTFNVLLQYFNGRYRHRSSQVAFCFHLMVIFVSIALPISAGLLILDNYDIDFAASADDNSGLIALLAFIAVLRIIRVLSLLMTNDFTHYDKVTEGRGFYDSPALNRVGFFWVVRTIEEYNWLVHELKDLEQRSRDTFGSDYLNMKIFITSTYVAENALDFESDSFVQQNVQFGRPNFEELIHKECVNIYRLGGKAYKASKRTKRGHLGVIVSAKATMTMFIKKQVITYKNRGNEKRPHITFIDGGEHSNSLPIHRSYKEPKNPKDADQYNATNRMISEIQADYEEEDSYSFEEEEAYDYSTKDTVPLMDQ